MKKEAVKIIKMHLLIVLSLVGCILILQLTRIYCPIRMAMGIPCPTCGITRSIIALLRFDFAASIHYHPLTIPIAATLLVCVHGRVLNISKKDMTIFLCTMSLLTFGLYIFRLYMGNIP